MRDSSSCANAARQLGDLLAQLPIGNVTESWLNIEATAQSLANGLRVRDGEHFIFGVSCRLVRFEPLTTFCSPDDIHTTLGRTFLPQTLTSLLKASLDGSPIPSPARTPAVFEILRIGANLCMDHGRSQSFPTNATTLLYLYLQMRTVDVFSKLVFRRKL